MLSYVPAAGKVQFGAFANLKPLLIDTDVPLLPLQVIVGAAIATPALPVAGTSQVGVYVMAMLELLLELCATDELLGFELDDNTAAELELCATDELLCGMLELLGSAFELLELCATDELLCTAFELLDRELELLVFVPELLGATDELELS